MRPGAMPLPIMTSFSVMSDPYRRRLSRGLFPISFRDHDAGERAIGREPSLLDLWREIRPEALPQCPNQRFANGLVVGRRHAIGDMLDGQSLGGRQYRVEIPEAIDHDAERCHELAALLGHVDVKERLRLRRDLK